MGALNLYMNETRRALLDRARRLWPDHSVSQILWTALRVAVEDVERRRQVTEAVDPDEEEGQDEQ